jgi:dynein heavy chain
MDAAKKELQELEDKILYLLNNIEGDILDDELMIDTLSASKAASSEISSRLLQSETTEMEISQSLTKYIPVAARVNHLYFAVSDLMMMNEMYRFSLQWFTDLFTKAIQKVNPNYELQKRIEIFNEEFTSLLYSHVSKGILEKDKLMFSFMVAVAVTQGIV